MVDTPNDPPHAEEAAHDPSVLGHVYLGLTLLAIGLVVFLLRDFASASGILNTDLTGLAGALLMAAGVVVAVGGVASLLDLRRESPTPHEPARRASAKGSRPKRRSQPPSSLREPERVHSSAATELARLLEELTGPEQPG